MSSFSDMIQKLKTSLSYVNETDLFHWNNIDAILVIKLSNTDSLNKDRPESHATQIQLTDSGGPPAGNSKSMSAPVLRR
jgi:hypothetical protein